MGQTNEQQPGFTSRLEQFANWREFAVAIGENRGLQPHLDSTVLENVEVGDTIYTDIGISIPGDEDQFTDIWTEHVIEEVALPLDDYVRGVVSEYREYTFHEDGSLTIERTAILNIYDKADGSKDDDLRYGGDKTTYTTENALPPDIEQLLDYARGQLQESGASRSITRESVSSLIENLRERLGGDDQYSAYFAIPDTRETARLFVTMDKLDMVGISVTSPLPLPTESSGHTLKWRQENLIQFNADGTLKLARYEYIDDINDGNDFEIGEREQVYESYSQLPSYLRHLISQSLELAPSLTVEDIVDSF